MKSITNKILEGKDISKVLNSAMEDENEYAKVKSALMTVYSKCNSKYIVTEIESPDEKHDRFAVQVTNTKYFWVEYNYETRMFIVYIHPHLYKNNGDDSKFNLCGAYKQVGTTLNAIDVFYDAMNIFTK